MEKHLADYRTENSIENKTEGMTQNMQVEWKSLKQVVIVRSLPGLGDFLCAVPALRALRFVLPEAHLSLISLPQTKKLVQRFHHLLDEWLPFPGYPGIPEVEVDPAKILAFLGEMQNRSFDLVLQMHGSGLYMNGFAQLLGAKQCAGFYPAELDCPGLLFMTYPEHQPEIWRHLQLMQSLKIPLQGEQLEFPLTEADWQEFEAIATQHHLHQNSYICLHPGASTPDRRWPVQQFAKVADRLAAEGFQIVLTGTTAEVELTSAVAAMMQCSALNLAGKTSLGSLAALLKNSRLLVCNDTGVSHLAAALQTPSVVIFCNSDPHRWAPLDRDRHRSISGFLTKGSTVNKLTEFKISTVKTASSQAASPSPAIVVAEAMHLLSQEVAYAS